jgi:hypothetical protein
MRSHASPTTSEVCTRRGGRIGASGGENSCGGDDSERPDRPKQSRREGRCRVLPRGGTTNRRRRNICGSRRSAESEGMAPIGALAHLEPDERSSPTRIRIEARRIRGTEPTEWRRLERPRLRARSPGSEGMAPIGALAHLEPDERSSPTRIRIEARRTRGTEPTEWRRLERQEPIILFTTTHLASENARRSGCPRRREGLLSEVLLEVWKPAS